MITRVYMFVVKSKNARTQPKNKEYKDNWCTGFYSSQSSDNCMCAV